MGAPVVREGHLWPVLGGPSHLLTHEGSQTSCLLYTRGLKPPACCIRGVSNLLPVVYGTLLMPDEASPPHLHPHIHTQTHSCKHTHTYTHTHTHTPLFTKSACAVHRFRSPVRACSASCVWRRCGGRRRVMVVSACWRAAGGSTGQRCGSPRLAHTLPG